MRKVIIYVLMALTGIPNSVSVSRERNFIPFTSNPLYYEMVVQGPTINASTVLECAIVCTQLFPTCYSFIFNQTTSQCTAGSWLLPSPNQISLDNGILYYAEGFICDPSKGFTVKWSGSLKTCILLSSFLANYTDALSYCKGLGSNLYAAKTLEKRNLLLDVIQNSTELWIGLDDLKEEGVFRWTVDDSVFDNSFQIFFQLNADLYGDQDCTCFSPWYYPFDDQPCNVPKPFMCEIS